MKLSKASAVLKGRDYVIPQDVKDVIHMALAHRIILNYDAKMKEMSVDNIIDDIGKQVKEPGIEHE